MTEPDFLDLGARLEARAARVDPVQVHGRLTRVQGTLLRATLEDALIGEECLIRDPITGDDLRAEVVGFDDGEVLLAPGGPIRGISSRAVVISTRTLPMAPAGPAMLGRVVDAFGAPLDDGAPIPADAPLHAAPPEPLSRPPIDRPLVTGLRAVDGLLTIGEGQRIGLFGAAGVGKSTLLSQIIRATEADAIVLGLIGERGREVREFLERDLGPDGLARAAVIVATSDRPATERLRAAYAATAAAEAFRAEGRSTLLLIDSATRVARAIREIGLSAGEPPVRRGFPPSTFALLPALVERAGRDATGAITAIYTVLVEGDDDDADPVADELRSLLDGHIMLSRDLSARGHFPAIDVLTSKSRVMAAITEPSQMAAATKVGTHLSKISDVEFLVQVGEYQEGQDQAADAALAARADIDAFLQQRPDEKSSFDETLAALGALA